MRRDENLIKWLLVLAMVLSLACLATASDNCDGIYGTGTHQFSVATGSPGELGLLKVLAEEFGKERKVDSILVHAPAAEKKAVEEGWAIKRTLIGSNEFYIVGPVEDPANIAVAKSAAEAYQKIANAKATFLSRGDNSGTHKKELAIWQKAGISPAGSWYIVTEGFMMATLKKANEVKGYFMTDSSTWVAGKKELPNLKILFRGDPFLVNTYHGLCQPSGATPGQEYAAKFIDFLGSQEGQHIIATYGKDLYGEGIYNDAAYAKQFDH